MYGQRQQHQQQLEAASYPLMQVAEICDCLSALNIPVQQEDIMKPHAASAQHIYSSLVAEIMGAPMDMIEQPKGALMGMMEYRVGLTSECGLRCRRSAQEGSTCCIYGRRMMIHSVCWRTRMRCKEIPRDGDVDLDWRDGS